MSGIWQSIVQDLAVGGIVVEGNGTATDKSVALSAIADGTRAY